MGMTLGSLFDGAGGFPLAGTYAGFEPRWASEIEPFPIRVTTKRFPKMRHLGDIRSIDGAKIEPVDVVTFGSPCQDLSVAGKRGGLGGERSGLFMEAIRIIKEMREATNGTRPDFIVWENVPGAFSSNKGEDFRQVLEGIARLADRGAHVPRPRCGWAAAGEIVGDGFSLAWRTLDAQYWGVPQRRRRIYLVADLAGGRAGQILFERESLRRDIAQGGGAGQGAPGGAEGRAEATGGAVLAVSVLNDQGGGIMDVTEELTAALRAQEHGHQPIVFDGRGNGDGQVAGNIVGDHESRANDYGSLVVAQPSYGLDRASFNQGTNAQFDIGVTEEQAQSLVAKGPGAVSAPGGGYAVRRLTPLECCRLQGFPDWWAQGLGTPEPSEADIGFWADVFVTHASAMGGKPKSRNQIARWLKDPQSDSAEYRMWGNSLAIPCAYTVLAGIAEEMKEDSI